MSLSSTGNANDEFQQWMQQQAAGVSAQKKEFQEYKDKRDKEFTAFLKANWIKVDVVRGEVRDEAPKPVVMPVAKPEPVVTRPPGTAVKKPVDKPVEVTVPKPPVKKAPVVAPVVVTPAGRSVQVEFYGKRIKFYYDGALKKKLRLPVDKDSISDYWSSVSRADYEDLQKQLDAQRRSLQLNDWAYATLVNKVSASINAGSKRETALLSWFILSKSSYRARIAYNKSDVYLLIPSQQELFEVSYFTFGGKRYYAVSFDGSRVKPGQVFTYDGEYPDATRALDMRVTSNVASSDQAERRHLSFEFEGKTYNIDVNYDRGRVRFLSNYPQLNLKMYFGSGVYKTTATPLQRQLAADMKGMSEKQAVNFLLRFVQTAFKYETDDQQFGEENYLFPEETLFYPYSDCEDRAVLFAWLVHSLLGLDVVGLDYPGHVATAVSFNEPVVGDALEYNGKRYVVTDPTYINANAGMTMPDFKRFKPKVISY